MVSAIPPQPNEPIENTNENLNSLNKALSELEALLLELQSNANLNIEKLTTTIKEIIEPIGQTLGIEVTELQSLQSSDVENVINKFIGRLNQKLQELSSSTETNNPNVTNGQQTTTTPTDQAQRANDLESLKNFFEKRVIETLGTNNAMSKQQARRRVLQELRKEYGLPKSLLNQILPIERQLQSIQGRIELLEKIKSKDPDFHSFLVTKKFNRPIPNRKIRYFEKIFKTCSRLESQTYIEGNMYQTLGKNKPVNYLYTKNRKLFPIRLFASFFGDTRTIKDILEQGSKPRPLFNPVHSNVGKFTSALGGTFFEALFGDKRNPTSVVGLINRLRGAGAK
ncbi:MAG: hypothetical protein KatS3mg085_442 [Candidatus Dojkabacteria bacterium]|nr:MAG: hypothetical protein KatS3mg085_442 [Candidatus Dojkabacteria bacterium]